MSPSPTSRPSRPSTRRARSFRPTDGAPSRRLAELILPLAIAGVVALLAGCGDDDQDSETTAATNTATTTERGSDGAGGPEELAVGDGRGGVDLRAIGMFDAPVQVTQPPGPEGSAAGRSGNGDDHLYVVEQGGTIERVAADGSDESTFLDVSDEIVSGGEQGLLSLAFAPDYPASGLLYVNYTDADGNTRVVEYKADGDRADPESARELLGIEQPYANHNGGLVKFGPDGLLYVGMGDGGSAGDPERNGLDLGSLLGKLLRIDPEPGDELPYSIPPGNPYADGEQGARPEIYSSGLRNPWRFSFDEPSGLLTIGDVGQDSEEEIDVVDLEEANGASFGWSALEGRTRFNEDQPVDEPAGEPVEPALTPKHQDGYCSITGGLVVRDERLPSLYGRYLYGDLCNAALRSFVPGDRRPARDDRPLGVAVPRLVSLDAGVGDRVYATSVEGAVYELVPE